ncbi:MAG: dephospho-CoA kinase [Oscillospiraceae bacterium]|nr:dephospho-CoA kinase [Oscillospiraceae bacterium]MDD4367974.1 dephospho-CoA kinase [Oscillospiraceae bacterium]
MFVLGITGGIGCGKSTAASYLADMGLPLIDADLISRQVSAPGGPAVPAILKRFGLEIVQNCPEAFAAAYQDPESSWETGDSWKTLILDREQLAVRVFNHKNELDDLSRIVHHFVIAEIKRQYQQYLHKKTKALVLDVPLPVKEGFLDLANYVLVIWADEAVRLERLAGRGMAASEARRRMAVQMTEEEYRALAQKVIYNNGSREALLEQLASFATLVLGERGIPFKLPPVTAADGDT